MNYINSTDPSFNPLTLNQLQGIINTVTWANLQDISYNPTQNPNISNLGLTPILSDSQTTITFKTQAGIGIDHPVVQFAIKISDLNLQSQHIPPGIWQASVYAKADANNDKDNIGLRFFLLGYNSTNDVSANLVANGSDIAYLYDNTSLQKISLDLIIQNPIDISNYNFLIVVLTSTNRNANQHTAEVYFQSSNTYSHIHTTFGIPGVAGATGSQGATGSINPTGSYWGQALNWNNLSNSWQITGNGPLAFGNYAGQTSQGTAAIAIGIQAGQNLQQSGAIAIGYNAGQYLQGTNSIAIGAYAGATGQPQNSIVINASGNTLNGSSASSCYIKPINTHAGSTGLNLLLYDTTTYEVVRSTENSNQSKTFVIEHPVDKNKYLVHACLEGPEGGIYYRGEGKIINNTHVTIELPYYVKNIGTDFTIQVTPIYSGKNIQLSTSRIENNKFTVYSNNGNVEFFWMVNGKRTNIDVEPNKNNVLIKGDGPYKWI